MREGIFSRKDRTDTRYNSRKRAKIQNLRIQAGMRGAGTAQPEWEFKRCRLPGSSFEIATGMDNPIAGGARTSAHEDTKRQGSPGQDRTKATGSAGKIESCFVVDMVVAWWFVTKITVKKQFIFQNFCKNIDSLIIQR
ncbi:MAG TPA: hypothetical protein ACFYDZ_10070 [Candidatus Brocadiaceae bacterium]